MKIQSTRTAVTSGFVLLVLGGALGAAVVSEAPFGGCTEVGVPDDANTGLEVRGLKDGSVVYSPDGTNVCEVPLPVALVPVAGLVGGSVLVVYGLLDGSRSPAVTGSGDE